MIYVTLGDRAGKSQLSIDFQKGSVGITCVSELKQSDFELSFQEWELIGKFLKMQSDSEA